MNMELPQAYRFQSLGLLHYVCTVRKNGEKKLASSDHLRLTGSISKVDLLSLCKLVYNNREDFMQDIRYAARGAMKGQSGNEVSRSTFDNFEIFIKGSFLVNSYEPGYFNVYVIDHNRDGAVVSRTLVSANVTLIDIKEDVSLLAVILAGLDSTECTYAAVVDFKRVD